MRRLLDSRWRHFLILLPLGSGVGLVVGILFRDVAFGVGAGAAFGAVFGLLFAVRNPR
ncbi:MAG: hypothetical protein WBC63_00365 [Candidatus Bipolaricaulia bacterium]